MPCSHRFSDILIPKENRLLFLFIGTFNPSWNAVNENNANYFYGRETNLFWCILPHAFNKDCLIDKGRQEWEAFCDNHKIGLTDIISCITNADLNNQEHLDYLTLGFKDDNLDKKINGEYIFNIDFTTQELIELIDNNHETLRGVFFTRSTNNGILRIWDQWQRIVEHCKNLNILCKGLPTPSPRGGSIRKKIFAWLEGIENSMK